MAGGTIRYRRLMAATEHTDPPALPEGTRVFYIGPPKTGTTSLQEAARAARETLYEHGVYYPGTGRNHRAEIHALMEEPEPIVDKVADRPMPPGITRPEADRIPPRTLWTDLMEDIDAKPSTRVMVTHEHAATASDDEAATFVRELGKGRTHVVLTLRPVQEMLVSRWIENLKEGMAAPFERWMEAVYEPSDDLVPGRMRRYFDQAGLIERWAAAAGPDNVTVIVVDKSDRNLLTDTFERLLDLPPQTLTGVVSGGIRANRSMSLPESQVMQRVNAEVVRPEEMSWPAYLTVVRRGAINRLLDVRVPTADEARVRLPQWAAERAAQDASHYVERIAASGVRVIGDLEMLRGDGPVTENPEGADDATVLRDIAVTSLTGAVRATTSYEGRLARRIERARERTERERARREKTDQKLAQEKEKNEKKRELLDKVRAKRDKNAELLEREKARHEKTRAALARLRQRTIRDQVRRLPAEQRAQKAAESFTTHELTQALRIRLGHKARTRRSLHVK